jgi:type II secretory pathway pseudopilin PulG
MVVMTVIAILSGVVLFNVNFNSDKRHAQKTARQLQQLAQVAADESLQLNRLLGIELFADGYRFLEWVEPEQAKFAASSKQTQNNGSNFQDDSSIQGSSSLSAQLPEAGYWDLLQGDKFLKQQHFKQSEDFNVELKIAGILIELLPMDTASRINDNPSIDQKRKPAYQPHLIFSPSGEAEDFTITITAKNERDYQFVLRGDVLGKLVLQEPGKEEE